MSPKEKLLARHVMTQVALEFSRGPGEKPLDISGFSMLPPAPKLPEVFTPVDWTKLKPKTDADMLVDLAVIEAKGRGVQGAEAMSQATGSVARVRWWLEKYQMAPATGKMHIYQIAQDLGEPLVTIQKALNELQDRARWKK